MHQDDTVADCIFQLPQVQVAELFQKNSQLLIDKYMKGDPLPSSKNFFHVLLEIFIKEKVQQKDFVQLVSVLRQDFYFRGAVEQIVQSPQLLEANEIAVFQDNINVNIL